MREDSRLFCGVTDHSAEFIAEYSDLIIRRSGYTDPDFPGTYDAHRPSPPDVLLDVLCRQAQVERPRLVVDLGSGTGLSTRAWAERADEVVGVEASDEMRARSEAGTTAPNVRYVHAFAQQTGLPDGAADIVTCSQSLHWMEPEPTFAEVARILRSGGVFAAYDYDWPPVVHWEVEQAFEEVLRQVGERRRDRAHRSFRKEGHLERMKASGRFRYVREVVLHSRDSGDAERIVGMALSLGPLAVLLESGVSEEEVGLARLRDVAGRALGDGHVSWLMCYRVRLGIK
jgi:SAM-dependent methyltransferase